MKMLIRLLVIGKMGWSNKFATIVAESPLRHGKRHAFVVDFSTLKTINANHWLLMYEAGSHHEALRNSRELQPDVLTFDLTVQGGTRVKVIETLTREYTATRIVVLTMHD